MKKILKDRLDRLLQEKDRVIVAVDGNCTAGKTTLAVWLAGEYDCNVFHMDDFFLRPHQRTPERLGEPGGNVDYERFSREVLQPLQEGSTVVFRPFDCSVQALGEPVTCPAKKLTIVEGTYSHHPFFGNYCDLRVFLSVTPRTQRARVLQRPAFLHERFFGQWIPMENAYFAALSIREKSHLIFGENP